MDEILDFLQEQMGRKDLLLDLNINPSTLNRYKRGEISPSSRVVARIFHLAHEYGMSKLKIYDLFMAQN